MLITLCFVLGLSIQIMEQLSEHIAHAWQGWVKSVHMLQHYFFIYYLQFVLL